MTKIQYKFLFVLFLLLFHVEGTLCNDHTFLCAEIQALKEKKNARLELTETEIDFGNITTGDKVSAIVSIHNSGNSTLQIEDIKSDITSISTFLADFSLGPGEKTTLEVILDATMIQGSLKSRIVIKTNDEENPEYNLEVRANIEPLLAFQPRSIFIGQIAKDAQYSGRAMLVGKLIKEEKLNDYEIETSSTAIKVKIQDTNVNQTGLIIEFVLKPEFKAGTFKAIITLKSNNPPIEAQLELLGQKLGIIKVTPDRFEFFPRNGKMPKKLEIIFECEKIFKITKVEDLTQSLNISLKTIKKGKKYRLTAKLKKSAKTGILGVVKVHTDLEEHPLIHIPVIGGRSK